MKGDLRSPWPGFLDRLDRDPARAWREFYDFGWRLLRLWPPHVFSSLSESEREDLISQVLVRCAQDDFRVLRQYEQRGGSFAGWLRRVAMSQTIDELRRRKHVVGEEQLQRVASGEDIAAQQEQRALLDAIRSAMDLISDRCRLLLEAAADGLKPRHMTVLLGLPADANKQVGDQLRDCRRALQRLLANRGWDLGE